jgi:hypothetical protein
MQLLHCFILNDMPLGPVAKPKRVISPARVKSPYTSHLSPSQDFATASCANAVVATSSANAARLVVVITIASSIGKKFIPKILLGNVREAAALAAESADVESANTQIPAK